MQGVIISFSENGTALADRLIECCGEKYKFTHRDGRKNRTSEALKEDSISDIIKAQFEKKNIVIFIGACGIAVRMIAPFINNKLLDSPVLVMDELGLNVIPILSGHVGGANEIAKDISFFLGANAVITTATDLNDAFAIDLFAKKNKLTIMDKSDIAKISSKALKSEKIVIAVDSELETKPDVIISRKKVEEAMWLKPKEYVFGIGCKRGTDYNKIAGFIKKKCDELEISIEDIRAVVSIDVKKDEEGLLTFCSKNDIDFITYSADELDELQGEFSTSAFVKDKVGVDNVCERSVVKYLGGEGKLVSKKEANDGVTIAVGYKAFDKNELDY